MDAQERIEAGEPPETARHAARRDFGNLARVTEDTRAAWGWTGVEQVLQDLRYAVSTASTQSGLLGRRDRHARRGHRRHDRGVQRPSSGAARPVAVRAAGAARSLLPAGARQARHAAVTSPVRISRRFAITRHHLKRSRRSPTTPRPAATSSRTDRASGSACCGSRATTSSTLRSGPLRGPGFDRGDEAGTRRVVLSDALWRARFDADASVIGSTIQLSGEPYEVVGHRAARLRGSDRRRDWMRGSHTASREIPMPENNSLTAVGAAAKRRQPRAGSGGALEPEPVDEGTLSSRALERR